MEHTEAAAPAPSGGKTKKWTKEYEREYMRKYMREKWRRDHNVKPENYKGEVQTKLVKEAEKFGEGAVEFYKYLQEKKKKAKKPQKPPVEKVVCQVCQSEHNDTPGSRKMHERTLRHKLAVELYEAHAKALAGEP